MVITPHVFRYVRNMYKTVRRTRCFTIYYLLASMMSRARWFLCHQHTESVLDRITKSPNPPAPGYYITVYVYLQHKAIYNIRQPIKPQKLILHQRCIARSSRLVTYYCIKLFFQHSKIMLYIWYILKCGYKMIVREQF